MTRTRAWPVKLMYVLIAAALAISLIIIAAPTQRVSADPDLSEWSEVSTPSGKDGVLAPDSTIISFAVGAVGDVAYAVWEGTLLKDDVPVYGDWLLKSDDHAATWDDLNDALDNVIDPDDEDYNYIVELLQVACDTEDPDFVAVALWWYDDTAGADFLSVFFSNDGGTTFEDAGEVEYHGLYLTDVFDLAISPEAAGKRDIAIGGMSGDICALFRSTVTADTASAWEDATTYAGWDNQWSGDVATDDIYSDFVTDIMFSPSWATDKTVLVTTVDDYNDTWTDLAYGAVYLQSGTWGTSEGWNEKSTLGFEAVSIKEDVDLPAWLLYYYAGAIAGITVPENYNGKNTDDRVLWVWVNYYNEEDSPSNEIVRVENDSADPVGPMGQIEDGELWLTNISYHGTILEGEAIAGVLGDGSEYDAACCVGVQVYRNNGIRDMDICCERWTKACKPPTGIWAMAVAYVGENKAYAIALSDYESYDEGAWSVTWDDGDTWNQLSLVDTYIDFLSDVAVSPDCNKTMLASVNLGSGCGCDSVWLHADSLPEAPEYDGQWLRTWCGQLEGAYPYGEHGMLRLAPEETTGDTVYLVDRGTGNVYLNELETLWCWDSVASTAVDTIVDLAVMDKETIYALDASGDVAMFDGDEWQEAVDGEVDAGWTIAVWGDDILVGGQDGDVSHSDDGGQTFAELKDGIAGGYVTVAFDSYFDINNTIYVAVIEDCEDVPGANGVYRWVIGESDKWYDLGAEPSTFQLTGSGSDTDFHEVGYTGLVLDRPSPGNPMTSAATGGVLYASYVTEIDGEIVTGVGRMLEPATDVVCKECGPWDYLIVGLSPDEEAFYMMPKALKICGCIDASTNSNLFAIDGIYEANGPGYDMEKAKDGTVWTFEDCYAKQAPDLTGPADGATIASASCPDCVNVGFNVMWDRLCDACRYDIQIALDDDFTQIISLPASAEDWTDYLPEEAATPSYFIPKGTLDGQVTYYWRVRAAEAETGQVIHSWWSDWRSFTIAPGDISGVHLVAPEQGGTGVARTNVAFSWSSVASATTYDFVLSPNPDLSAPIDQAPGLATTAHQYTGTALAYDTPYYWQVTALKGGSPIDESTIGSFRTMPETPEPIPTPEPTTPFWVWVVIAIGAVLVIVVIVLIFRTRRV